jgi:hypothetical protein
MVGINRRLKQLKEARETPRGPKSHKIEKYSPTEVIFRCISNCKHVMMWRILFDGFGLCN